MATTRKSSKSSTPRKRSTEPTPETTVHSIKVNEADMLLFTREGLEGPKGKGGVRFNPADENTANAFSPIYVSQDHVKGQKLGTRVAVILLALDDDGEDS